MPGYSTLDQLDVAGKRVLLRVDLNLPMDADGKVSDTTRAEAVAGTVRELVGAGAKVVLLAHRGRPKGAADSALSLAPIVDVIAKVFGQPVAFAGDCVGAEAEAAVDKLNPGEVLLLENLRFHAGEEANDNDFAAELAALGEIYVNDAFSCCHRAHASTAELAALLPAAAGRALEAELAALEGALGSPERPLAALVGGAKVSTKLSVLGNLVDKVDQIIIGGGMANTFLFAEGRGVGASLCEHDMADTAREIMSRAKDSGCEIVLPLDLVVAAEFKAGAPCRTVGLDDVPADQMILDVGANTVDDLKARFAQCRTLVWNGPLGAFEISPFDIGTNLAAQAAAAMTVAGQLNTVAGGGDTVAALKHAGVAEQFTYVSTAGGAFLEWLEGRDLPGVMALTSQPR